MAITVDVGVGDVAKAVMGGLDDLFTSDEERAKAELKIVEELNKPHIMQAMINLQEAKHPSMWVSGWRPALGWLMAVLLAYSWIGRDVIIILLEIYQPVTMIDDGQGNTYPYSIADKLPEVDTGMLMTLTLAMLGLGATHMAEKIKGVARIK